MIPENPSSPRTNVEIPEAKANLFSIFTFWWANDLISLGHKRLLEKDDLYVLNDERTAKILTDNFEIEWQKETQKMAIGKKPSLLKALYRVLWFKFCLAGVCRLVGDVLIVTSPFILRFILKFVTDAYYANFNSGVQPPAHVGYTLIVIMFLMQMSATISQNLYFYWGMETGILSRTILITAIYRKALVLSGKARGLFTNGKITNLMSTDTTRIDFACGYFHMIWTVPIQICLSLIFLIYNIGPSAIAGFTLLLLMGPIQGKVISLLARTRAKAVVITDERVKLIQEILLGIRAIKYYAWEDSFADALNKLRNKEISFVRFLTIFRASVVGVLIVLPVFASVLSFTIFSLTGGNFNAEIAFSSVALFYILQSPLTFLQFTISSVADAYVSINRINDFLLADELTVLPGINPDEKYAIKVTDGDFIWETSSSNETINKSNKKKEKEKSKYYRNDNNDEIDFSTDFDYEKAPSSFDAISDISTTLTPIEKTEYLENSPLLIPKSQLHKINISIPRGKLIAIVGPVGSGKSSLLSALIGEMKGIKGEVIFGGNVGYCPQTAWIQNATLRDNITFGLPFNYEKYHRVIKDCCLEPDLNVLPSGDLTEIGEKGVNLSGGQKQRVNVARAVYYNADIILLDDPLSAVDAHVGRRLFTNCIKGALDKKTRLLVTHHLHYLPQVDYIICMEDGEIAEQGTYEELMKNRKNFSKLIAEYGEAESDNKIKDDDESTLGIKENKKDQTDVLSKGLMSIEEQYIGSVNYEVYLAYIRNAGGFLLLPIIISLLVMMQVAYIGNSLWLSFWINKTFDLSTELYIGVYWAWAAALAISYVLGSATICYCCINASKNLHNNAIKCVLRAPTNFFDTTPLGRIINRFSKDTDTCDNKLSDSFRIFFLTISEIIATFILTTIVFIWFIVPLVPLSILYYLVFHYYQPSNRQLKRLDSVLRSSLYAHFSETLTGLPTIRAYHVQKTFLRNNETLLDIENRAYFLYISVQRWLSVRLETISNILIFFASLFAIIFRLDIVPSIIGLVLAYTLQTTQVFNLLIDQFSQLETDMNSVERLVYYCDNLEKEAENIVLENRPPFGWPAHGEIHIKNLEIKYGPDSPLVLKGISVDIKATEKIGIIGRTGCGKSTLAMSFFRFIEATSGSIVIDDVDISTIGLKDLRSNITIIPQDPVLFNGTIRSNLDPFNKHSDLELWNALYRVHLVKIANFNSEKEESEELEVVHSISDQKYDKQEPIMLDSLIKENGSNFSQGQQQLIAMARALVRHSKLIIMDEATASIDFKTDNLIQTTIRDVFKDSTVITIAHRLRTVADYDKILVMDNGNVVEYDIPYLLMQKSDSLFRELCERSGDFAKYNFEI
ncbi:P-loop containing nucleoside triphosphate hydrolase protein [Gigaspora rosea]|uniref:P-loop containing nucleoside triphosphate hydrolase protein n=1 Tax=Gigaspora rosea TaxID=44941 RepID=A0A397V849_9GLOM|nr:P-loop containing nucleoside triphosphate hydrolase protein [Gigaspora rosea]